MKTKLIVLGTLTILILFNINIEHIKCVSPDSTTISFSTSSEIHWEDPSYVQGDTYTVNVYSGGITVLLCGYLCSYGHCPFFANSNK